MADKILQMANGQYYNANTGNVVAAPSSGSYLTGTVGSAATVNLDKGTSYNPNTGQTTQGALNPTTQQQQTAQYNPLMLDINGVNTVKDAKTGIYGFKSNVIPASALAENSAAKLNETIKKADTTQTYGQVRNLANEQTNAQALRQYLDSQTAQGKPLTSYTDAKEWGNLVNAVTYGGYSVKDIGNQLYSKANGKTGTFNLAQPRAEWKVPGSNDQNPDSQIAPAEELQDDQGLIDLQKFETSLMADMEALNKQFMDAQTELDNYEDSTMAGGQNIGQQVGETAPLLQGEQLAYQQQRELGQLSRERALSRIEQAKSNRLELANTQMQIMQYGNTLRKDQQDAAAQWLEMMTTYGGKTAGTYSAEEMKLVNKYSKALGVSSDWMTNALDYVKKKNESDSSFAMRQSGYVYLPDQASLAKAVQQYGEQAIYTDSATKKKYLDTALAVDQTAVKSSGKASGGGGNNITPVSDSTYVDANGKVIKLTATQVDTVSGFDNTMQASADALALIEQGVETGPVAGRTLQAKKLLGTADEQQMELEQIIGKVKADFMKAISGAAVSDREVERLSSFLPSITDQESVVKSKLNTLVNEMQRAKNNFVKTLGAVNTQQTPTKDYSNSITNNTDTSQTTPSAATQGFWSKVGDWLWGE